VISLEKLLMMKALAMNKEKYLKDTQLIVQNILSQKYKFYDQAKAENSAFVSTIQGMTYIDKTGPEE
jgi:hypothetical protein